VHLQLYNIFTLTIVTFSARLDATAPTQQLDWYLRYLSVCSSSTA